MIQPGVLFNGTFWFNAQWWDGPSGTNLPGQVDTISSDLELAFYDDGPWTTQVAFHPQIVNSYGSKIDKYSFNFDGRVVTTYKASPEWSFVGGLAVWDRVNTLIIPHVGAIWTPNNRWEVRALFPKSRVSYFLGNRWNADFWLYGQYEYTAQAWQTTISPPDYSDRTQITDQRLTAGLRWDSGRYIFSLKRVTFSIAKSNLQVPRRHLAWAIAQSSHSAFGTRPSHFFETLLNSECARALRSWVEPFEF